MEEFIIEDPKIIILGPDAPPRTSWWTIRDFRNIFRELWSLRSLEVFGISLVEAEDREAELNRFFEAIKVVSREAVERAEADGVLSSCDEWTIDLLIEEGISDAFCVLFANKAEGIRVFIQKETGEDAEVGCRVSFR